MVVGKLWYQFGNGKGRYVLCTYLYYNLCYYIKNAFFVQKLKKCYISDTLSNFFRIKNVLNHLESFSTCKKLHLETIGMANFSKWNYWLSQHQCFSDYQTAECAASRRFYLDSNPEQFMSPKLWQSLSAVLETLVGSNRYQVKIRRLEPRKQN